MVWGLRIDLRSGETLCSFANSSRNFSSGASSPMNHCGPTRHHVEPRHDATSKHHEGARCGYLTQTTTGTHSRSRQDAPRTRGLARLSFLLRFRLLLSSLPSRSIHSPGPVSLHHARWRSLQGHQRAPNTNHKADLGRSPSGKQRGLRVAWWTPAGIYLLQRLDHF